MAEITQLSATGSKTAQR